MDGNSTMDTLKVKIGNKLVIGEPGHIVVQTMCNTHTYDVDATVAQCKAMAAAGAELIRITVPGMKDVPCIREIKDKLRSEGVDTPLVQLDIPDDLTDPLGYLVTADLDVFGFFVL